MKFKELEIFLNQKMRMSHIYQPVLIKYLLQQKGSATDNEIAIELLKYDPSQIEYYKSITNNMVGKVLRNHGIINKQKNVYTLSDFKDLSNVEVDKLIELCNYKAEEYISKRGEAIWNHRRNIREYIPGSVKYEVLKRANFHCELCGISAEERALEVDHIIPVNKKGENNIDNYQALCYSCNAMKRDTDNTNFSLEREKYSKREKDCPFCYMDIKRLIFEDDFAYMIYDKFPVTPLHCLIIPKRHFSSYFEISQPEINNLNRLILKAQQIIRNEDENVTGFNIGANIGETAGQTIFHCHIHMIPRREKDMEEPKGGIRNLFAGKGTY